MAAAHAPASSLTVATRPGANKARVKSCRNGTRRRCKNTSPAAKCDLRSARCWRLIGVRTWRRRRCTAAGPTPLSTCTRCTRRAPVPADDARRTGSLQSAGGCSVARRSRRSRRPTPASSTQEGGCGSCILNLIISMCLDVFSYSWQFFHVSAIAAPRL